MMRQSEWCRQDLYSFTCIAQEGVLWNQMIKFALNTYGLSAHGQWWWIWILIWTLTWRIWAECGTRRSIGHGPSCTKFYLVIPGTECSQTQLFLISGNDPKFSYDLIKFYSSQKQDWFLGQLELWHFKFYCYTKDFDICWLTSVPYYST